MADLNAKKLQEICLPGSAVPDWDLFCEEQGIEDGALGQFAIEISANNIEYMPATHFLVGLLAGFRLACYLAGGDMQVGLRSEDAGPGEEDLG